MLSSIALGSGLAFAAAIQPGPFQAYLFSSVAQRGWKSTLPAALAPLVSDWPIIITVLFVLTRLPDSAARVLEAAGGLLLLYFAWSTYRQWRRGPVSQSEGTRAAPRTLLEATGVNLLNPNPWIGWTLVMGPSLLAAWHISPAQGLAFLLSFYGVMISMTVLLVILMGTTALLSPPLRHALILVSAILLGALGVYRLISLLMRAPLFNSP